GVTPGMTKEQAVRAVQSLDKKKIYEIIDAAPDAMPARLFKEHLSRTSQQLQSSQLAVQTRRIWNKLIKNTTAASRHSK
ncbi:MAG: hypothetical protein Q8O22_02170, partial [Candidatus Omnitrophota bacterium]|nr:hypothetical protein [Candidatus Omnitrophota bacterium]